MLLQFQTMIQFFSSSPVVFYPQEHEEKFSSLLKNVIRISNLLFVLVYLAETHKENIVANTPISITWINAFIWKE